ncbi:MAG: hypothetical protein VCC04_07255, partial [Myxococcota bacterium]
IVRGYKPEALSPAGVKCFDNPDWENNGEIGSLVTATSVLKGDVVVAYGDVIFKRYILHLLLSSDAPITIIVDSSRAFLQQGQAVDRVQVAGPPSRPYEESENWLEWMASDLPDDRANGEWIGMLRMRGEGTDLFREALAEVARAPDSGQKDLSAVFNHLAKSNPRAVRVVYVQGDWVDINSLGDVVRSGDV